MSNIDEEIAEVNAQIHECLVNGATPQKRRELVDKAINLNSKKVLGSA